MYTGCCAAQNIPARKLLPCSIYDILTHFIWFSTATLSRPGRHQLLRRAMSGVDTVLLTFWEETKQPRCPIAGFPAPWILSSAGKLIRYLHGSYLLPYHSADVFCFCFYPPSLSFCHSARLFTERSLLRIMRRHAQGTVKRIALDMVQSSHTCEMNWTLGVNRAQARIRSPSVSTS